jgi:hypothetical protein
MYVWCPNLRHHCSAIDIATQKRNGVFIEGINLLERIFTKDYNPYKSSNYAKILTTTFLVYFLTEDL